MFYGKWILLDFSNHEVQRVYADPASIVREGSTIFSSILVDLSEPDIYGSESFLSLEWREENDCVGKRFRIRDVRYFSHNLGRGTVVVRGDGPTEWRDVIPDGSSRWEYFCDTSRPWWE